MRRESRHSGAAAREDQDFCRRMLPLVSRTFALSIEALPEQLRSAVRVSYLLCRLVDTIEDAVNIRPELRTECFDRFDHLLRDDRTPADILEGAFTGELARAGGVREAELSLGAGSGAVLRAFRGLDPARRDVIRPVVLEMSHGMREYSLRPPAPWGGMGILDLQDLERYCYFVAGVVGRLLTGLFLQEVTVTEPRIRIRLCELAISFGLGLQLVNILKDVADDFERGICFLPGEMAARRGLSLARLLDPDQRQAGLTIISELADRAREHLLRAEEYSALWPVSEGEMVRLFCIVPLALAYGTLEVVERGEDTLRPGKTPSLSRGAVMRVIKDARHAARSHRSFDQLFSVHHPRQSALSLSTL